MRAYALSHLSEAILLHDLSSLVAQERNTTAEVLAHIAEVDARRLYLPAGYPSMHAYCVGELRFSDDAAFKRIQAARAAREFPAIFSALAEGRLHLGAVCLLAAHLTRENADELLAAAAGKTKSEIDRLLTLRFPRAEAAAGDIFEPRHESNEQLAPGQVGSVEVARDVGSNGNELAPGQVGDVPTPTVKPLAPQRIALRFAIEKSTHDKLRYVQALLSHRLPTGDVAQVFDRALDALVAQLEKQKFGATSKPRSCSRRTSTNARHIPAHVRQAVWQRDQGRCTFVGETGHRCGSRRFLEYDHVDPVARGGRATVEGLRLRCRGHNQLEAERVFGADFMSAKREQSRRASEARTKNAARACPTSSAPGST
jgi:5-methylcytosine-specific restriction endonuclease McrA